MLYRVLAVFLHQPVTAGVVLRACGMFFLIFLGSMAIGEGVEGLQWLPALHQIPSLLSSHHTYVKMCSPLLPAPPSPFKKKCSP